MKGFSIFLFLAQFFFSCVGSSKNPNSDPYSLETLTFLEEVLSDVWENTDSRETAIARLRSVCRNRDTDDGFLCYTWGLIEYKRGNYNESYSAFKKALERNPDDTLYKNLLRLSAEKSENLEDLANSGEEGKIFSLYSSVSLSCRSESKKAQRFPQFLELAKLGMLTKDMVKRGSFADCFEIFSELEKKEILPYVRTNPIHYAGRLVEDRVKSDPFSKLWDTSHYHTGATAKEGLVHNQPISESWRKLKIAARAGNVAEAREVLKIFLNEIQLAKKKGNSEASLALALERSAKLLLEQDPYYIKVNFLSKEF